MKIYCISFVIVLMGYFQYIKSEYEDITSTDFIVYTDWAYWHNIRLLDLNTGRDINLDPNYPLKAWPYPCGIAYHSSSRTVFFTLSKEKKICKFVLGIKSDVECIFQSDQRGIKLGALALDNDHGKLYIADRGLNKIYRMSFDGSMFEEVFVELGSPRGLAVDRRNGFLYFSHISNNQFGVTERVPLSDLSSTLREQITWHSDGASFSVHVHDDMLYWTDMRNSQVKASNLDGSSGRVVATIPAEHLHGITSVGPNLYVSDLGNAFGGGMIYKLNPKTGIYTEIEGSESFASRPYLIAGSH